jgi:hypothetical protein
MSSISDILLPICLHDQGFSVKKSFNMLLKLMEFGENFIFMLQEENPCEFGIIIYKTHIKFIPSNRSWARTPHI